jgi:hypothetical protein
MPFAKIVTHHVQCRKVGITVNHQITPQDSSPPSVVRSGLFLRAWQPVAARPAGIQARAAVGGEESGN